MQRRTRLTPVCSALESRLLMDSGLAMDAAMPVPVAMYLPPPPQTNPLPGPLIPEPVAPSGPTRIVPPPVEITGPPSSAAPPDPSVVVTVQPLDMTLVPSASAQQAAAVRAAADIASQILQEQIYNFLWSQAKSDLLGP